MKPRFRLVALVAFAAASFGTSLLGGSGASADPAWAPAASAPIHPGVQTFTNGAQCTANFVFFDAADVYIGQAAHCSGTGAATETDGCDSGTLPLGTEVEVSGASRPGVMVYSSWITMQALGEGDPNTCAFNDFALIRLDPADAGNVNPSIPSWGGPTGINASGTVAGDTVYSYGNSGLRFGLTPLSPKQGISVGDEGGGWSHAVVTVSPGIPGDSGSPFVDAGGRALGVLSTLQLAPLAGSNGVGDVGRELQYLRSHTSLAVQLALGTEPFNGSPLDLGGLSTTVENQDPIALVAPAVSTTCAVLPRSLLDGVVDGAC